MREQRFGFPLIEVSNMTEMLRVLLDHEPPRKILTHAFARSTAGVAVGVVNELDHDVAVGSPGEMMIRDTELCDDAASSQVSNVGPRDPH